MNEQIFTNYRLQLPDQEMMGTLVVRDGIIADVQPGVVGQGTDGEGAYLMPGLVELHTDHLEKCMSPRPSANWPLEAAATYHDRDLAASGITTVCDAIAIGDITPTSIRYNQFGSMIDLICQRQESRNFSVDHRLHLRCELAYDKVADVTEKYATSPHLALISLMDHTPGQRQFVDVDKYREYYVVKHGVSEDVMDDFIRDRIRAQQEHAETSRKALVDMTRAHHIPLASHDDETLEHVHQAIQEGAAIAEFPTTLEAAKEAHQHGLQVLMGGPNLILGGSHSGNVSAMDLVELNMVDIISSDYVPHSLLHSIFFIAQHAQRPLHETLRLVTLNPAKAIGLKGDRGSLEVGKRADFITVQADIDDCTNAAPQLQSVLVKGCRVA
ncbi:MAG: alpha-D-ribose 1-methylphosphonate 5-triphosphate diphosphatase [Cyanobacteria bacterium P01_A01_bin.37]